MEKRQSLRQGWIRNLLRIHKYREQHIVGMQACRQGQSHAKQSQSQTYE